LQDASNEIILADDEDGVRWCFVLFYNSLISILRCHLGEVFVEVNKDDIEEYLAKEEERIKGEVESLTTEISAIKKTLADLKIKLYAKFSSSINLEEE
jgi:prefoldin subunit 4